MSAESAHLSTFGTETEAEIRSTSTPDSPISAGFPSSVKICQTTAELLRFENFHYVAVAFDIIYIYNTSLFRHDSLQQK